VRKTAAAMINAGIQGKITTKVSPPWKFDFVGFIERESY
jgi:hypothetical protein